MRVIATKDKIIECCNKLTQIFEKPIDFSGKYVRPVTVFGNDETEYDKHKVRTHLSEHDEILTSYFSYVHKWFPANPHKENIIERGNELYIDKITLSEKYNNFPKKQIINAVLKDDSNPSLRIYNIERIIQNNKYIFVKGNKGVGKTTFFNYWLNNRTRYLENHEKKIWFRVDASKLYGIWLNFTSKNDYSVIDLESFHKAHTIYVVAKYGQKGKNSNALRQGWNFIQDIATEDEDMFSLVEEIEEVVNKSNFAPDGKDTERFFEWAIKNDHLKKINRIYEFCHNSWLKIGYKIIFIVDGVDNISWARDSIEQYNHLCHEIGRLFISDYRKEYCDHFANIIIVVRPETYKDIESKSLADHMNTDNVKPYFKGLIAPTCTYNILTHKAKITKAPVSKDINEFKSKSLYLLGEEKKYSNSNIHFDKEIEEFNNFSTGYIEGLMEAIKSRYKLLDKFYSGKYYSSNYEADSFEDISQIIEIIFNDNIRACVDNFIENYSTIKLAKEKQIPGATSIYRYPEYLLLNGRLFLDSPEIKTRVRGESYPNLFWWDASWVKDFPNSWYGLGALRILQFLNKINEFRLSILKDLLSSIFKYPDMFISKQVDRLIKYGLIEYSRNRVVIEDYHIRITKKGKFILEYTFMYTDWLYFCALDTPLENSLCHEKDTRFIKIHRDLNYNFINTFNVAYITTIITFCRHLWTQQKIDKELISDNWYEFDAKNYKVGVFNNTAHAISFFSFPEHFSYFIKRDVKSLFIALLRRNKNEANILINDLIGVYPKELSS